SGEEACRVSGDPSANHHSRGRLPTAHPIRTPAPTPKSSLASTCTERSWAASGTICRRKRQTPLPKLSSRWIAMLRDPAIRLHRCARHSARAQLLLNRPIIAQREQTVVNQDAIRKFVAGRRLLRVAVFVKQRTAKKA